MKGEKRKLLNQIVDLYSFLCKRVYHAQQIQSSYTEDENAGIWITS